MSNLWRAALLLLAIPALAACASTRTSPHAHAHSGDWPEATPFDPAANAGGELELAFAVAAAHDAADQGALNILAIFGANWCRDSRALAGWPETPRFRALTDEHFVVVYSDAGVPQTGEGRNLELAERFGVTDITGTPTMLMIDGNERLLNTPEDAKAWRNASMRSEDEIYAWLEGVTAQ